MPWSIRSPFGSTNVRIHANVIMAHTNVIMAGKRPRFLFKQ